MSDDSWNVEPKKELTPQEVLKVAYSHLVDRISQHHLAAIYGVNQGRVNEAVKAMKWAADHHRTLHAELMAMQGSRKKVKP